LSFPHTTYNADRGTPDQQLTGHAGEVTAVAIGRVGDHDLVISGSDDFTGRI
jgi:hypothetical protein